MYYECYIDQFIAEQLLTGFLLLRVTVRLLKEEVSWKRIAAGSAVNACLMAAFLCLGIPYPGIAGMAAAGAAVFFGKRKHVFFKNVAALLFVTLCFGGAAEVLLSLLPLPAVFGWLCAAETVQAGWKLLCRRREEKENHLTVRLYWQERSETLRAIRDTGNQLTEPLSGAPVSIVRLDAVKTLLGEGWECRRGFYMVPYHSLGTEKSWMRAVAFDRMEILEEHRVIMVSHPVVAFYDGKVSAGDGYQMILHPQHCRDI